TERRGEAGPVRVLLGGGRAPPGLSFPQVTSSPRRRVSGRRPLLAEQDVLAWQSGVRDQAGRGRIRGERGRTVPCRTNDRCLLPREIVGQSVLRTARVEHLPLAPRGIVPGIPQGEVRRGRGQGGRAWMESPVLTQKGKCGERLVPTAAVGAGSR